MKKVPSIASQIAYYDRWNEKYRAGNFPDIDKEIRFLAIYILEHIRALRIQQPKILEIGCGTGWATGEFSELGQVTAIDLSPRAIEIARGRGVNAEFISGDFLQQDFVSQAYDVAICIETLFYVSNQPAFIKKLATLLKPRAVMAFSTINKFVYERSSDIGPPEEGQIRHWLSKREMLQMLATHFDVISVKTLEPRGDLGVLRLVNSYTINRLLGCMFSDHFIKRVKENLGLGGSVIIIARRNANP